MEERCSVLYRVFPVRGFIERCNKDVNQRWEKIYLSTRSSAIKVNLFYPSPAGTFFFHEPSLFLPLLFSLDLSFRRLRQSSLDREQWSGILENTVSKDTNKITTRRYGYVFLKIYSINLEYMAKQHFQDCSIGPAHLVVCHNVLYYERYRNYSKTWIIRINLDYVLSFITWFLHDAEKVLPPSHLVIT